jgi:hypothetical protein
MSSKMEAIISSLAAALVLFTALLDPYVSIGLAVVVLIGLAIYNVRFRASS